MAQPDVGLGYCNSENGLSLKPLVGALSGHYHRANPLPERLSGHPPVGAIGAGPGKTAGRSRCAHDAGRGLHREAQLTCPVSGVCLPRSVCQALAQRTNQPAAMPELHAGLLNEQ